MKTKMTIISPLDNRCKEKEQVRGICNGKRFEKAECKRNGDASDKHNYNRKWLQLR
jgi:hypothetical protein